jgi:hypothetical protein
VHIENFQEDGGNKLPSKKNTPHMHDQFGMIPEEIRKFFLSSRRHLSAIARESDENSLPTSRTHTKKFPTLMPNVQYEGLQTWIK